MQLDLAKGSHRTTNRRPKTWTASILFLLGIYLHVASAAAAPENLLRNGSFEGGMLYWHNLGTDDSSLVRGGAAVGEYALQIKKGFAMSAPFVAKRGESFTVSFFVRGDKPGVVDVSMPPSAREVGTKHGRLWVRGAGQTAKFGTNWQHVSFTWPADVPPDGFWPNPHYLVQIGGGNTSLPIYIDGVTVVQGSEGTAAYVPRREIEIVTECRDLPGYEGAKANLFERGATPRVTAHLSNPGKEARAVTVRWQLFDYEGEQAASEPIEKKFTILPGRTLSETVPMKLTAVGMVLARVSVFDDLRSQISNSKSQNPLDSSDLPLTSLPYPKSATKPDWRERFGGSFAGGLGCVQKFQRLGFGWIRWRPHSNGEDHLPKEPANKSDSSTWEWKWFDQELAEQEAHGQSSHLVLYPPPKWIMEKDSPLPKDMRWPANDPRWNDLSVETVWDKFVKGAVMHYKNRSVIYEIENEPEFDKWDNLKETYAQFTIRTARLIRQTDAKARVMVDNVYGIPSGVNAAFFKAGGLKFVDVMSWHDYHEGWLTDAVSMKRMRQNMDEAGGKHVEIWFNEGWAFSNTAVDEPIACTHLTSAQSANAIVDCVAELTANGQDKTILFHTAYETHGMSFWDYSGPGTMLWDWYNYPLPIAAAWNVLAHHIGVSEAAGFVRPPGANFCIFQDQRNNRGVTIAYADRESKADVRVKLPDFGAALASEDMMGNITAASKTLLLSKSGRPVYLYAANGGVTGKQFAEKLAPLDRKHASFVSTGGGGAGVSFRLPPTWEGPKKDSPEGNPALANGKPVWRLDQIWPSDPMNPANYRLLVWRDGWWQVMKDGFGGQPKAEMKDSAIRMEFRAAHGTPREPRTCGLAFIAPQAGTFNVSGSADLGLWDGNINVRLAVLHKTKDAIREIASVKLTKGQRAALAGVSATLAANDELVFVPRPDGAFVGGDVMLRDLVVSFGGAASASGGAIYKLPASWEGVKKGSAEGNPISADGRPIWRIDQLWPDNPIMADGYAPMPWSGTEWKATQHEQGGQPAAHVENGSFRASVRGPWTGNAGQKTCSLIFIAPKSGVYTASGTAKSKPWEGGAKTFKLGVFKKDTQRAAPIQTFELPRDGSLVPFQIRAELTAGHELVFLPLMPDWHNATTTTIENLAIQEEP